MKLNSSGLKLASGGSNIPEPRVVKRRAKLFSNGFAAVGY